MLSVHPLVPRLAYHLSGVCPAQAEQAALALFAELEKAYGEAHRHYHTLEHVAQCLAWLDWCWGLAERPQELGLALWFHDCVYDPARNDNEARSAAVARQRLAAWGAPAEVLARIEALILATAGHAASEGDVGLLLDIDLAILGAEPRAFARFEAQVREEYRAVPEPAYALGRARVLRGLCARTPFYSTPFLRAELEERAQANLERALRHWEALTYSPQGAGEAARG